LGATILAGQLAACAFALDFDELQEGDDKKTGTNAVLLNDAAAALTEATCDRLLSCVGPAAPIFFGDSVCDEFLLKSYQSSILDGAEILTSETFEYHPTLLPACVDAIRNKPCGFVGHIAECQAALEGKVAQGGACVHPLECASGLYCDVSATCPGTCLPHLNAGEECRSGDECAEGLDCVDVATGKECAPLVTTEGAPCDNGEPKCAVDMLCLGKADSQPGTCQRIATTFDADLGNACNTRNGPFCSEGLVCRADSLASLFSTGAGTCSPPSQADAACTVSLPDPCPKNYYCKPEPNSIDGTCAPLPGPLQQCAPELAVVKAPCRAGTVCVELDTVKVCQPLTENDAVCSTDQTCYSGYCLNDTCSPLACNTE
jgi:hypothetical protein